MSDDAPSVHCGNKSSRGGFNIGAHSFAKVLASNHPYVDKTDFIEEHYSNHVSATIITRPRRFGKSLLLSAMRDFYWNDHPKPIDFTNYNIFKKHPEFFKEHHLKYPVLYLDFSGLRSLGTSSDDGTLYRFTAHLYNAHPYLKKSPYLDQEEKDCINSLSLSKYEPRPNGFYIEAIFKLLLYLQKHSENRTNNTHSVIILIDEYDTPIMNALLQRDFSRYRQILAILKTILVTMFKDVTSPVKFGVLMGVFDISKDMSSAFNNVEEVTISSTKYSKYFGFTTAETECLFRTCGTHSSEFLTDVKNKYNGYRIGDHLLYNPWSINRCLASGELDNYWADTGTYAGFVKFVRSYAAQIQLKTRSLLERRVAVVPFTTEVLLEEIYDREEFFWSYLLQTGYVTFAAPIQHLKRRSGYFTVKIPNEEIFETFEMVFTFMDVGANVTLDQFLNTTLKGHKERLTEYYSHIHAFHEIPLKEDAESPSQLILETIKFNFPGGHFYHYVILNENVTIYERKIGEESRIIIFLSRVSLDSKNPERFKGYMLKFWDAVSQEATKKIAKNLVDVTVLALVYCRGEVSLFIHSIVQHLPHLLT